MSNRPLVVDVLHAVADAMRDLGVPWYLFGAQAAIIWGSPRLSADVDVTVGASAGPVSALIESMARNEFEPLVPDAEFISRTRVIPFVHRPSRIPLDLVLGGSGLEEDFVRRAVQVNVAGRLIPVISPEDLLVTKVLAGRPKDIEDIRAVLRARPASLDIARIRSVLRLLEQALAQSDLLRTFESELVTARSSGRPPHTDE